MNDSSQNNSPIANDRFVTPDLGLALLIAMTERALTFSHLSSPDWQFVFYDPEGMGPELEKQYQALGPKEYAGQRGIAPGTLEKVMRNLVTNGHGLDELRHQIDVGKEQIAIALGYLQEAKGHLSGFLNNGPW
jgi:hypothetical protein